MHGENIKKKKKKRFKCFNVNFRLLTTIYVHLLVCYLNKLQNARCNDKDTEISVYKYVTLLIYVLKMLLKF